MACIDEGFDFLSFTIRRMRKRGTAKHYVYTIPSRKAIQAVKDKISAKTYRSTRHLDPGMLIQSINQTLAGWANYFRHGVSKAAFSAIDAPRVGPDHALAAAQVLPPRDASTAPPFLQARNLAVRSQRSQVHRCVRRAGHPLPLPLPLPRQHHTGPVGNPAGPSAWLAPAGGTRGSPGAVRTARRVRRAGRGNPPEQCRRAPRSDPTNLAEAVERAVARHRSCLQEQPPQGRTWARDGRGHAGS